MPHPPCRSTLSPSPFRRSRQRLDRRRLVAQRQVRGDVQHQPDVRGVWPFDDRNCWTQRGCDADPRPAASR